MLRIDEVGQVEDEFIREKGSDIERLHALGHPATASEEDSKRTSQNEKRETLNTKIQLKFRCFKLKQAPTL